MQSRVFIVGIDGTYGGWFRDFFHERGAAVGGCGLSEGPAGSSNYVRGAPGHLPGEAWRVAEAGGTLVFCCPTKDAKDILQKNPGILRTSALIVDIASAKTEVFEQYRHVDRTAEILSIHPMFSPRTRPGGQRLVVVCEDDLPLGPRGEALLAELDALGVRRRDMNAEAHDTGAGATQVAGHFALLGLGLTLAELKGDRGAWNDLSTPVFRTLVALLRRMSGQSPAIYAEIQRHNGSAEAVRAQMRSSLAELDGLLARGDDLQVVFEHVNRALADVAVDEEHEALFGARGRAGAAQGPHGTPSPRGRP